MKEDILIDITIPRECIYRQFEKQPGPCPRCSGLLKSHPATYLVTTRRGKESTDSFIMGGDFGWFCTQCPTVVIDPQKVGGILQHSKPGWDVGAEFAIAGIVDLDAIPEDKTHLPLGDEDNPIPLVEFTNISGEKTEARPDRPSEVSHWQRATLARDRDSFEERYEDVLQNIEFGIIQVYRNHPEMTDWQALDAIEALLRKYRAETKGRQTRPPSLDPLARQAYDLVETMCEWRLGRGRPFTDKEQQPVEFSPEPITLDEITACLKRIRKSINRWRRIGGRQGYLTFVEQYIV